MATTMGATQTQQGTRAHEENEVSGWTVGFAIFAGSMMLLAGFFQFFEGLAAVFNGDFFVIGQNYTYSLDISTWGWVHMILGAVLAFAGTAIFSGRAWGRVIGITLAILSAIANFFFIPYSPFWSLTIIGVNIAIIAALAAYGPKEAGALEPDSY